MDGDRQANPRDELEAAFERLGPVDLPALAMAWSGPFSDVLAAAHRVLAEHERGDLSHVLGPVLDRIPRLAALVTDDELLVGDALAEAEHALEVLEGVVVSVHAADLLPTDRRASLAEPWRRSREERQLQGDA
jgi:hypothetical protein